NAGIVDEGVKLSARQPFAHLRDGAQRILGRRKIDLDVVLRPRRPRTILRKGMTRAGDDAPARAREALHRGMPDAAARARENERFLFVVVRFGCRHRPSLPSGFQQWELAPDMPPQDLTALALMLLAAVLAGLLMNRLRLPAVVGFILVGTTLGPTGFGVIEQSPSIETLADLGVLMLLFILGMELRLQSFRALLPLAVGVTIGEIVVMTGATSLVAQLASGETTSAIVIGFMLAISSTAVAIKMMDDANDEQSRAGKLAV